MLGWAKNFFEGGTAAYTLLHYCAYHKLTDVKMVLDLSWEKNKFWDGTAASTPPPSYMLKL